MRETLKAEYAGILCGYLSGAGEAAELQAYDFARKCLRGGLAPDDVLEFHIDLVERQHGGEADETVNARAQSLFIEVVMAFSLAYRQTLEELERSNRELASVSQFKSRMLSMVAHDLTNHMTAIKIFAGGIARQVEGAVKGHAQNILEVIGDQEVLVQNLLDIGRIDTGRLNLVLVSLPLLGLVERAVERMSRTSTRHSFSVVGSDVRVRADQAKVQQILENVIGNAIKYSPEGGPVDITLRAEGGQAQVEVRDRGLGIAADDLPHVFEPFYRGAHAEGTAIRGTGLGLSIVHSLVTLQGGTISADSHPGDGTTVRFSLPLAGEPSVDSARGETGQSRDDEEISRRA